MPQDVAFADLEIRVLARQDGGYPVELTFDHEREFMGGFLDPGVLPWIPSASPAEDGQRLFDALLAGDGLREAWAELRGKRARRRVRLRLHPEAPELHTIPWELLVEGEPAEHLAAKMATPFSRYLAGRWQPGSPILRRPIRILAVIANPEDLKATWDLEPIDVEEERLALEKAIAGLEGIELGFLSQPCTTRELEARLQEGYHVLHFVGHGAYREDVGQAALLLANRDNQAVKVQDLFLARMLARQLADDDVQRDHKLRLVFLASCQTATRSPADAFRGFAPVLIEHGVPAVVAMQDLVGMDSARTFAATFYQRLLEHGLVDLAGNEARAGLLTAELPGVGSPVLFMRLREGRLFGQRGRLLEGDGPRFWPTLLGNIAAGECTPILGPGMATHLLPHLDKVAEKLAEKHNYPYEEGITLPRVAQYVGTLDPVGLRRDVIEILTDAYKKNMGLKEAPAHPARPGPVGRRWGRQGRPRAPGLVETIRESDWSDRSREILESEAHHQLADLPLPLYLTTNFDSFMALALEAQGIDRARREIIPWHRSAPEVEGQGVRHDLEFDLERPVVLHLFGTEEDPASMVLTQDNYLDYLARISRDHEHLLPESVGEALAEDTLLFLGYRLEDLDLKVITRGLLAQLNLQGRPKRFRVIAQLEELPEEEDKRQAIIGYLNDYFADSQGVRINVYWGSPEQFVADLHARWQAYVEERYG